MLEEVEVQGVVIPVGCRAAVWGKGQVYFRWDDVRPARIGAPAIFDLLQLKGKYKKINIQVEYDGLGSVRESHFPPELVWDRVII